MALVHHTVILSKAIAFINLRLKKMGSIIPEQWLINRKCGFLKKHYDKQWFVDRLSCACVDIEESRNEVLSEAVKSLTGKIEILGGEVSVSDCPNWHQDFKCGKVWTKGKYYTNYSWGNKDTGEDVKTVWELSRCHHLLWWGQAYMITSEEQYAKSIVQTIDNWIKENPYNRSINWTCSMEIAIRAVNWMYAVKMVIDSSCVDVPFLKRLFSSLYMHGLHIFNNLEIDFPYSANHYASNVAGLVFIGYLFDCELSGKRWLDYSLKSYLYEVRTQILPSGFHFEKSVSYHRLMTELFLYTYILIKRNNPNFIAIDITNRIEDMISTIISYTKPNGFASCIADDDNGRFLPFVKEDYRTHGYLINIARKNNLKIMGKRSLFPDAGLAYVNEGVYWLSFSNTGNSRYPRPWKRGYVVTHTHQDALSIELSKGKEDFIIDPGSYVYTSSAEKRNEFRSTIKHNTMSVDGKSRCSLSGFFLVEDKYSPRQETADIIINTDGSLYSSTQWLIKDNDIVEHHRKINVKKDGVTICDKVECKSIHTYIWSFHLKHGVHIQEESFNKLNLVANNETISLDIDCQESIETTIEDDTCSPSYGILENSKTIRIKVISQRDFNISFNLK